MNLVKKRVGLKFRQREYIYKIKRGSCAKVIVLILILQKTLESNLKNYFQEF